MAKQSAQHDSPGRSSGHGNELDSLYQISRILNARSRQREMLAEVLDVLAERLGMNRGTIMLLSPDGRELMIEVAHNLSERQLKAVRYRMGEGISGRVVQTGKPAVVPKVSQEPLFLDRLHKRRMISKDEISYICVPISIGREVVGCLSADRVFDETAALEEDVRLLTIVASMIAHDVKARRMAAEERHALEEENIRLRSELEDKFRPENIIGNSNGMREVYQAIHQVAASDTTALIRGESGTGKELVAHAIHYSSPRAKGAFVKVNCAALSENLLESELFGHEKGAFTGAIQARKGRIEEAEGGTLFLDEIGEFSPATQVKLLRVLQEREFQRVGSNANLRANVRIIAATSRDLEKAVEAGQFRQDLYYRVNVFPIHLPPLRERKDDILLLADFFVEKYAHIMSKDVRRITTPAINMMFVYHWPGNVRELENCIERAVLLSTDGVIHAHHMPPTLQTSDASDTTGTGSLDERLQLFERDIIVDALKRSNGNVAKAARDLRTTQRILGYKAKMLGLDFRRFRTARQARQDVELYDMPSGGIRPWKPDE
ncbi:MAG: nif-specific transcriptional activator NifA [Planctomycetes bacterium]|nr:nif-specific transcriptional activator NifA [Planctomycetota bacterium]